VLVTALGSAFRLLLLGRESPLLISRLYWYHIVSNKNTHVLEHIRYTVTRDAVMIIMTAVANDDGTQQITC
jgi:hypothetical protein